MPPSSPINTRSTPQRQWQFVNTFCPRLPPSGHSINTNPGPQWTFRNTFPEEFAHRNPSLSSSHSPKHSSAWHSQSSLGAPLPFAGRIAQKYYSLPPQFYM